MRHAGEVHEWRCRVKLAVRGTVVRPAAGLFERQSHRVLPLPRCRVHHPRINDAVAALLQVSYERFLGDAESSLGDAKSSLGDAKSSLGDAKSSLGDAKSSLGDAKSSLGDV
jgi:tRNA/tmRNA/rRNA uracil-C5-methylase (TrmA/RlmC/RlmD family)